MNLHTPALRTISRVLRTRYAGFVIGLPLRRGEIPVFTYHDVQPADFAGDLEFLRHNGYRTLSLAEFMAVAQARRGQGRSVLLTFDDARRSFRTVALPLLRDFDARAALFAPTYWLEDPAKRPGCDADLFMSWNQVRECADSGCVDVQSHAHRHALVFTSNRLIGFAAPREIRSHDLYDWPMRGEGAGEKFGPPTPGTPIYEAEPLLSARRRYVESAELAEACRAFVVHSGGEAFCSQSGWFARLRSLHSVLQRAMPGRIATAEQLRALVASEFEESRAAFVEHLGRAPEFLAYPWMVGTHASMETARSAGIRAAFGSALDFRAQRRHLPIRVFGRLKSDWLRFLPGRGRASVLAVVGRKLSQLPKQQHVAH